MIIDSGFLTVLITAFSTGLLGSLHCVGMCGGIATALGMSRRPDNLAHRHRNNTHALLYQFGRISSYAVAGMIAGSFGEVLTQTDSLKGFSIIVRIFSAVFVIGLGLYIAGWFPFFSNIEKIGLPIWKKISPLAKKLIPVKNGLQAYLLGSLWGWIPCGLTYSILLWTFTTGSMINSALIMIAFGLGTLPAMLSVTIGSAQLSGLVKKPTVRKIAGVVMLLMGVYLTLNLILMSHHKDKMNHSGQMDHSEHMSHEYD